MSQTRPAAPARRRLAWIGSLLVGWAAVGTYAQAPVVVTSSPWLNEATFAVLVAALPLAALWHGARLPRTGWTRAVAVLTIGPLAVACSALAACAALSLPPRASAYGASGDFVLVGQAALAHSVVRVYRTNGGATTDFGIEVRQEAPLAPGLLLVRPLYRQYHAFGAAIEPAGPTRVRVRVAPTERGAAADTVVAVRPRVYL